MSRHGVSFELDKAGRCIDGACFVILGMCGCKMRWRGLRFRVEEEFEEKVKRSMVAVCFS